MITQVFCIFACLIVSGYGLQSSTPQNIQQLFSNACAFVMASNRNRVAECQNAWNKFRDAFKGKNSAEVEPKDYFPFIDIEKPNPPASAAFFYTGTGVIINRLPSTPDNEIYTANNMLSVKIVSRLQKENNNYPVCWCGEKGGDGYDYTSDCCKTNAYNSFWAAMSIRYAQSVDPQGDVFWLGMGNRRKGTFDPTTYFAKYEIKNLQLRPNRQMIAIVLCVRRGNRVEGKTCNDLVGETGNLQKALQEEGIRVSCYNLKINPNRWTEPENAKNIANSVAKLKYDIIQGNPGLKDRQGNKCIS